MTNINPIKFGVAGSQYFKKEAKEDLTNKQDKNLNSQTEAKKNVDSKEVLGYLAAQNTDLVPSKATRTIDVKKYVTAEQAARIENFVKGFETDFDEISQAALNEFPDLTGAAADGIALAYINASY